MTKEELEKENAELKRDKQNLRADLRTARNNLQAKDTVYQLAMEENAELRHKLNKLERKCKFNFVDLLHDVENESKQEKQLTKAKELLKEFCTYYMYDCDETRKDYEMFEKLKKQAEQFISEVEK